ncbi:hypothetical protein ACFQ60_22485 [Streptomyces zhihengii]
MIGARGPRLRHLVRQLRRRAGAPPADLAPPPAPAPGSVPDADERRAQHYVRVLVDGQPLPPAQSSVSVTVPTADRDPYWLDELLAARRRPAAPAAAAALPPAPQAAPVPEAEQPTVDDVTKGPGSGRRGGTCRPARRSPPRPPRHRSPASTSPLSSPPSPPGRRSANASSGGPSAAGPPAPSATSSASAPSSAAASRRPAPEPPDSPFSCGS